MTDSDADSSSADLNENEKNIDILTSRVWAEIDLDALHANMETLKSRTPRDCRILPVIKADAYGHGARRIARELEKLPYVWGFGVASPDEALRLRGDHGDAWEGTSLPVLILGPVHREVFDVLISRGISLTEFRTEALHALNEAGERLGKTVNIHIALDTGMGRIGIRPDDEGIAFVREAISLKNIRIEGVFSHFARGDERDKTSPKLAFEKYKEFTDRIKNELGYDDLICHIANSGAILDFSEAHLDMVRAGIAMYGIEPSDEVPEDVEILRQLMSLRSRITYIKRVQPGETISYGETFKAESPMRVGTVSAGYADGIPRGLSGCGHVLIAGHYAPILGRVCMDQFMVDLSDIPEASEGDVVTVFGSDGGNTIRLGEASKVSGRFWYEIPCLVTGRVPRIYTGGDQHCRSMDGAPLYDSGIFDAHDKACGINCSDGNSASVNAHTSVSTTVTQPDKDEDSSEDVDNTKNSFWSRVFGPRSSQEQAEELEDEILSIVSEGKEQGIIEEGEAAIIGNVFEFMDKDAGDIMTHRTNIVGIPASMHFGEALQFLLDGNQTRYPVYEDNIDHIIGILYFKDAMRYHRTDELLESPLSEIKGLLRETVYVPKVQNINDVFRQMQRSKSQFSIVIDEYGQTAGLLTMEDILEELVGNILDEYDEDESHIISQGNGEYILNGRTPLEELEKRFGLDFSQVEFETVNGYIISRMDHVPEEGEDFECTEGSWSFRVTEVKDHMVSRVVLKSMGDEAE